MLKVGLEELAASSLTPFRAASSFTTSVCSASLSSGSPVSGSGESAGGSSVGTGSASGVSISSVEGGTSASSVEATVISVSAVSSEMTSSSSGRAVCASDGISSVLVAEAYMGTQENSVSRHSSSARHCLRVICNLISFLTAGRSDICPSGHKKGALRLSGGARV